MACVDALMQDAVPAHSPQPLCDRDKRGCGWARKRGGAGLGKVEKVPSRNWGDREHRWRAAVRLELLVWGPHMGRGQSPQLSEHSGQAGQALPPSRAHAVSPPWSAQPLPSGKDL